MLTRRDFLMSMAKFGAIVGAYPVLSYAQAISLGGSKIKGAKRYVTGCMWCQNGCSMIVYVKDGKVVHLTGNPEDRVTKGKICIKPFGSVELLSSPLRLTHPLKRIGDRGDKASFIKISWEQALDEIAFKLKKLRERYGGECLGIWASGRSAADGRALNKAFAKLYGTPNYEKTGPFCNYAGKVAGVSVVGTRHTPWTYDEDDFFAADMYIFVGSNIAATRPVIFSNLMEKKKSTGCKIVVVDPRCSETAKEADEWLCIRPGRDLALALGMLHYVIEKKLYDIDFVRKYTTGFEKIKEEIAQGKYSLSWASGLTGIPEDKIAYLAREYASTRRAIVVGNSGISHHTNAVLTHRAFYLLASITGHFGDRAMGYCCLNNGGISLGKISVPKDRIPSTPKELCKNPMGWLESLEDNSYPYKLRALISTGSPLTQWPQQERLRRLLGKLELSIYNGITKNINAYYFDYILPAAFWLESGGVAPVSDDSRFVWVPQVLTPPGEARPDRWWWIELGKRMGWGDIFKDEYKDPSILQEAIGGKKGYTAKNFLSQPDNALRAPIKIKGTKIIQRGTLFLDKKFPTKSGKIEIWTEKIEEKFKAYGLDAIPHYYTDPDVADLSENTISYHREKLIPSPFQKNKCYTYKVSVLSEERCHCGYPFFLITGRPSKAIMGHTSHWIKLLNQVSPDQFCLIHKSRARKLGISDGDKVLVQSRYGETTAKAVLTHHIEENTVFIPYSYGEKSPYTPWKSVNFLTDMNARCPISGEIAFKGIRVTIRKA